MPVDLLKSPAEWVMVLSGEIDVTEARGLHGSAVSAVDAGVPITLDLGAVMRLDTSAIQVLLALKHATADGAPLRIVGAAETLAAPWRAVGLGEVLAH